MIHFLADSSAIWRLQRHPELTEMWTSHLHPDVPVPKSLWRWIESAQHRLAGVGALRSLSVVDLLVCGTAAAHGLQILHDDADFELAARRLTDVEERRIVG